MKLEELNIADGRITEILSRPGIVIIKFMDWQEKKWNIIFDNVLALQCIGYENEDIAEVNNRCSDDFLAQVKKHEGEDEELEGVKCYSFISAWKNEAVLKIVASTTKVELG